VIREGCVLGDFWVALSEYTLRQLSSERRWKINRENQELEVVEGNELAQHGCAHCGNKSRSDVRVLFCVALYCLTVLSKPTLTLHSAQQTGFFQQDMALFDVIPSFSMHIKSYPKAFIIMCYIIGYVLPKLVFEGPVI